MAELDRLREVESEVLQVYRKVSPSDHGVLESEAAMQRRLDSLRSLFHHRLHFPIGYFAGKEVIDFGCGRGNTAFAWGVWGASQVRLVEMNAKDLSVATEVFSRYCSTVEVEPLCTSIFEYESAKRFDIAISTGVIHHTEDPRRAFDIICQSIRIGGYLILGVGTSTGQFQRNLMRCLLFSLGEKEEEIVGNSKELFAQHIQRATAGTNRSAEAVIYDSFVNPKIKVYPAREVISWFGENGFDVMCSYPYVGYVHAMDSPFAPFAEVEGALSENDVLQMFKEKSDKEEQQELQTAWNQELLGAMLAASRVLGDVENDRRRCRMALKTALEHLDTATARGQTKLDSYFDTRVRSALDETIRVIRAALTMDASVERVREEVQRCESIFNGLNGVGMTYYSAHRSR